MEKQEQEISYADLMREEFALRTARNRRYSLKAFARDLGVPSNHLSEILRRKRGLSAAQAERVAERLGFEGGKIAYFSDLVAARHSRSEAERSAARKRARAYAKKLPYRLIAEDTFKVIEDWFHFGILELTKVDDFKPSVDWVAHSLNLPRSRVKDAVARLKRLGLLKADRQHWEIADANHTLSADIPSRSIQKSHAQLLQRALTALREQSVAQREFNSLLVAVDETQIPEVKARIREFLAELDRDLNRTRKKSKVFCLGVQFFELSSKGGLE